MAGKSNDDNTEGNLELSVSAPETMPYKEIADPREDAAYFDIEVTNRGDESVLVEGRFKIGPLDEPILSASPTELEPGETETDSYGVMSRDLGPGDHEWTVTANDETETGTLTVTGDDETDDEEQTGDGPFELSVSVPESIPYKEIAEPGEDAADFYITVTNHGDEPATADIRLQIGWIDEPFPLDLAPGETDTVYTAVMSRDLGVGEFDWTVSVGDKTETGTLTVTDDEER